jgi:siroheme synthase
VGAGSGNSGLVTLRAKECIARADVVVHGSLVNPIVFSRARQDAEIINRKKEGWGTRSPKKDHHCFNRARSSRKDRCSTKRW